MLCQLNEGKALDTKQFAEQYRVRKRTIQRDINMRLMMYYGFSTAIQGWRNLE